MLRLFSSVLKRRVANGHGWQDCAIFAVAIIQAFLIYGKKTRKLHNLPSRAQTGLSGTVEQIDRCTFHARRCHLAGHRAFEDQVIQTAMVA